MRSNSGFAYDTLASRFRSRHCASLIGCARDGGVALPGEARAREDPAHGVRLRVAQAVGFAQLAEELLVALREFPIRRPRRLARAERDREYEGADASREARHEGRLRSR